MLGPGHDLILKRACDVAEVVAVAWHPHDQVAVLIRVRLGVSQCGRRDDIELDVMPAEPEVCPDEAGKLGDPVLPFDETGAQLDVEERTGGSTVVYLGGRSKDRGGTQSIATLRWRLP